MAVRTFLACTKVIKKPFGKQKIINPQSLGEHILNMRLEKGLLQKEVAAMIGVSVESVTYWENGRANPQRKHYPKLFAFLGYYPFEHETESIGGKLRQVRSCMGMTVGHCAKALQVSENAILRWEAGKRVCNPFYLKLIERAWQELPNYCTQRPPL